MNLEHVRSSHLESPLQCFVDQRRNRNNAFAFRRVSPRASSEHSHLSLNWRRHRWSTFPQFSWSCADFVWRNSCLHSRSKIKCTQEPLSRSKELIRSFLPLWEEGLLLIRCSVFVAVLSAAGLLVWYCQFKSRSFVEAHLLPSVCSILSEYLQREINFGKVRSVSPFGITLQSCSVGPHQEEFSCGELPTVKLRVRPFASMKRGKIVIDAVLAQPNILIAQKEDFSWLGIPTSSGSSLKRHSSSEEGIDFRTKTRRVAREKAAADWAKERAKLAREFARLGYIIPLKYSKLVSGDAVKDVISNSYKLSSARPFFCMNEHLHRRDHHSVDMGIEYGLKHAELEKSFGIKTPSNSWFRFWPRMDSDPLRHRFKRKTHKKISTETHISSKLRILRRSAAAALAYFNCFDSDKTNEPFVLPVDGSSYPEYREHGDHPYVVKDEGISKTNYTGLLTANGNGQKGSDLLHDKGDKHLVKVPFETVPSHFGKEESSKSLNRESSFEGVGDLGGQHDDQCYPRSGSIDALNSICQPHLMVMTIINRLFIPSQNLPFIHSPVKIGKPMTGKLIMPSEEGGKLKHDHGSRSSDKLSPSNTNLEDSSLEAYEDLLKGNKTLSPQRSISNIKSALFFFSRTIEELLSDYLASQIQRLRSTINMKGAAELAEGVDVIHAESILKMLPVTLDSVYFSGGSLMLLGYGDQEPREMEYVNGYVKFQNLYSRVHVQISGNCMEWRSDLMSSDGGQLSADIFVDSIEQNWHANLSVANLFAPLFERILEIPVKWSKGRATGEVHICMSAGETFPKLHGQLDVNDLSFEIVDAPSCFTGVSASLCFQGQRIFLHNASGWFGDAPLEASGDFGINPDDGEFHLMCQVPCVEVNDLMKTLKMKPLLFSVAGSVTAVFNCQGPLDAPMFVGSGMISRKAPHLVANFPLSPASEAVQKNKEAGAVAAFDRIPFTHVSANFTFNTDNCVADLYGIRATILDGGEIRGAGNAWICSDGEEDDSAMDINLSGSISFDKVILRYLPNIQLIPLKIGELNGETKLSGALLRPRFDIKWSAPKAEDSFADARGNIIIAHEHIIVNSSSVAFDLYTKVQTVYADDYWQNDNHLDFKRAMPLMVEGVDLDLRMRGFEFANLISSISPRPMHLKATGRLKFQGKVTKTDSFSEEGLFGTEKNQPEQSVDLEKARSLVGEVSLMGIRLNQLMVAPQLSGTLSISNERMKLDATGRPDENFSMLVVGPFWPSKEEVLQNRTLFSVSLQKGQLRASIFYQPGHSANLEVRHLPLDELELASLRGTIQRAELQLNFQKRRGLGMLSVLQPKFSGVLGEALNMATRWSGDVHDYMQRCGSPKP